MRRRKGLLSAIVVSTTATALLATPSLATEPSSAATVLHSAVRHTEPAATAPAGRAGAVLASATLPSDLWLADAGAAYRMTYDTTGPHGVTPCTGMVFVPKGPAPPGGWPVIAWAHGTVGDGDADAPSRNGVDSYSSAYVNDWLHRGYAIAATDYIGLGTPGVPPYLDGDAAAHAVIDSVRAAREIDPNLSRRWAVVGLSEGGQAAVFTGHLATTYAPELDFRGTVANGVPSNIDTLSALAGPWFPPRGMFAGLTNFMSFTIAGFRDAHPEIDVNSYLTPIGRRLVDAAPTMSYEQFAPLSAHVSVAQMLSRSLNDPTLQASIRSYLQIPLSGYDRPLLVVQGMSDDEVPLPLTRQLITEMDAAGSRPDFQVYPGGHLESMYQAESAAAQFVATLFR